MPSSLPQLKATANAAYRRFCASTTDTGALEVAIQAVRDALGLAQSDDERAVLLGTLGVMLTDRYQVGGSPRDLEEGLWSYRRAVELTPQRSSRLARRLSNLAAGLHEYSRATSGSEVLREAFDVASQAVALTPADSPDLAARVLNYSAVVYEVLVSTDDAAPLDEAITLLRGAIAAEPPAATAASLSGNLATFLMRRFDRRADEEDLREAIVLYRRALDLGVADLYVAGIHSNLGNALWRASRHDDDVRTLRTAVEHHRQAVDRTPADRPVRIDYLTNLGTSLANLAARTGDSRSLEQALTTWEHAWRWIDRYIGRAPVAHVLGLQDDLGHLSARMVTTLLDARHGSGPQRRRALTIAEGSKSRLLAQQLGWVELPAPPRVDEAVAARERALTRELRALDATELLEHEVWPPAPDTWSAASERAGRRARNLSELEGVWSTIAACGPEGAAFAELRRGASDERGRYVAPDATALLSVLVTPEETVLLLVRADRDAPEVVRAPVGEREWADIARRMHREIHTGRGADRGESWLRTLLPPLRELAAHLDGIERVVIAPHRRSHLTPWSVLSRRAGWTLASGAPMADPTTRRSTWLST